MTVINLEWRKGLIGFSILELLSMCLEKQVSSKD
jgi:hypothetical protein